MRSPAALQRLMPFTHSEACPWSPPNNPIRSATDPACARVDFMNALTAQLWPHAERAASRLLLKDGFLERLL